MVMSGVAVTKEGGADHRRLWEQTAEASHKKSFPGAFGKGMESCFLFHFPMAK